MVDFAELDKIAKEYWGPGGGQPGLAFGLVRDGELVHSGGFGERFLGGPPPDADTVFRISSMTKSFTAAAVVLLRDEGMLALDDPVREYVPEMRGWPPVTADSAPVTVRHLLTMTAGFPADDAWADRQQGLPLDDFAALLSGGVSFAWAPDTKFEYASLGYAILGRLITAVSGLAYPEFVRQRLLDPLGMTRSGYEADEFAADELALGYQFGADGWAELPMAPCGAFAPIGGAFSSVRDLARWMAGFLAVFPPGGDVAGDSGDSGDSGVSGGDGHPLAAASRRQMQLGQVFAGLWPGFPAGGFPMSYGFGLYIDHDPALGQILHHPGGYPGFGSHMRWHPASGIGVVGLANSTYATPYPLTVQLLEAAVRQARQGRQGRQVRQVPQEKAPATGPGMAPRGEPWPETAAAREAVNRLLRDWDDAEADRLFTPNVAQDVPYSARRRAIERIRAHIGPFADDPDRPVEYVSPAHCRWWLTGEGGTTQAQILLSPEQPPRVQWLSLAVPPAPGSPLASALARVISWLNGGIPVAAGDGLDPVLAARRVGSAAAWAGNCRLGPCRAGNGTSSVTVDLTGEHASLTLAIAIDPDTGLLHHLDITGG